MVGNHGDRTHDGDKSRETAAFRAEFDWSEPDQPSAALVELIARTRNVDPLDLEPLQNSLDTDALNALFDGRPNGNGTGSVVVTTEDYRFRIDRSGSIVAQSDGA